MPTRLWIIVKFLIAISIGFFVWQPITQTIAMVNTKKAFEVRVNENLQRQRETYSISTPMPCILDPIEGQEQQTLLAHDLQDFEREHFSASASQYRFAGFASCLIGNRERALQYFRQARQAEPQDAISALQLIALYTAKGDIQAAAQELQSSPITDPQLIETTKVLIIKGKLPEALSWCRLTIERNPTEKKAWALWITIGNAYDRQQKWETALQTYQSGLDFQQELGTSIYRGSFSYRIGVDIIRTEEKANASGAIDFFNQAIEAEDFISGADRANAYMNRGNWFRAGRPNYGTEVYLQDYQSAIKADPESDWAALMLGIVYFEDKEDLVQAEKYLRLAVSLSDKNPNNFYRLGIVLYEKGDLDGAIEAYTRALELKPDFQAAMDRLNQAKAKQEAAP